MDSLSNNSKDYTYYVYSGTIARVDTVTSHLEVKQHNTNQWKEINDPKIWQRIQNDGDQVSKEKAEEMYRLFHNSLKKSE